jgi:4-alpha-glucanotransferase
LRAFWELDPKRRARYAKEQLKIENPPDACTPVAAEAIIRSHLESPSRIALFLMQDLLAMDSAIRAKDPFSERINDPADPNYKWDWRLHLTLEELMDNKAFTSKIQKMVEEAKR